MSDPIEKAKGSAKEVAGKVTGSDELAREGQHQQKKEHKEEEAAEARQEAQQKEQEAKGHKANESKHQ